MAYIAARFTHFPHIGGAVEAAERGHGPEIQIIAEIVSRYNYLYSLVQSAETNYDVADLLTDLGMDEDDARNLAEEDWHAAWETADKLVKQKIAEDAEKAGFKVFWIDDTPFIIIKNRSGTLLLGVEFSPHDDDVPVLHFIFVSSDMPLPVVRRYMKKVLNMLEHCTDSDVENGWAELVYYPDSDNVEKRLVIAEEV